MSKKHLVLLIVILITGFLLSKSFWQQQPEPAAAQALNVNTIMQTQNDPEKPPAINQISEQSSTLTTLIHNNDNYLEQVYKLISAIHDEDGGVNEFLLAKIIDYCYGILPIRERVENSFSLATALPIPDEDINFMSFLVREIDKCLPLENDTALNILGLQINGELELALLKNAALKGNVQAAGAYLAFHPTLQDLFYGENLTPEKSIGKLESEIPAIIQTVLTALPDTKDPSIILYLSSRADNRDKGRALEFYACSMDDFCSEPFNRYAVVSEYWGCIENKILMTTHLIAGSQQSCKQQVTLDAYINSLPNIEQTANEAKNIAYHLQKKDFQAAGLGRLVKLLEILESKNSEL